MTINLYPIPTTEEWSVVISMEAVSSANVFSEWLRKGVPTMRPTVKRLLR